MSRLPQPGGDEGQWGDILNNYLSQSHRPDGSLKDAVVRTANLADNIVEESKLSPGVRTKLNDGGSTSGVSSVNTRTGAVTLTKDDVGLTNVDNTSDASKPISAATQTALGGKVTGLNGASAIWIGRQLEYDAIASPSPTTVYVINGS